MKRFLSLFAPIPLGTSLRAYLPAISAVRALGILRALVFAWLLTRPEFGTYQLGLLFANLAVPLAGLGLHEGLLRFVPEHEARGHLPTFLSAAFVIGLLAAGVTCATAWIGAPWFARSLIGAASALGGGVPPDPATTDGPVVVRTVSCVVATLIAFHLVLSVLRARRMFRAASTMELGTGALFTTAAVIAALVLPGARGVSVLWIYAASCAAAAALFALLMPWQPGDARHSGAGAEPPGRLRAVLQYSVRAGAAALCWQLLLALPALYLQRVAGRESFATFDLMRTWTQVSLLATVAIAAPLASTVTRAWETAGRDEALRLLNTAHKATMLLVICGSMVLGLGRGLVGFVMPDEYHSGLAVSGTLLSGYAVASCLYLLALRLVLIKRSGLILVCWLGGCVAAGFATVLLVDSDDGVAAVQGAARAGLTGLTCALILLWSILRRLEVAPDRGVAVLAVASVLPLTGGPFAAIALLGLPLLSLTTGVVLSASERGEVLSWIGGRPPGSE